jgi:hypothetical protein
VATTADTRALLCRGQFPDLYAMQAITLGTSGHDFVRQLGWVVRRAAYSTGAESFGMTPNRGNAPVLVTGGQSRGRECQRHPGKRHTVPGT